MRALEIGDTVRHCKHGFGTVIGIDNRFCTTAYAFQFDDGTRCVAFHACGYEPSTPQEKLLCERAAAHFASLRGER